ncbi:MAG: sulfatase-like hydrolase/transferase [Planctomycetota bacterium]
MNRIRAERAWRWASALAVALPVSASATAEGEPPPNVLLITADDMGWDSLGCTGNTLGGLSPNLDRLAAEGILIDNCHIVAPICGPSRHGLYTGQYPQRTGYMGHGRQPPRWWKAMRRTVARRSIASDLAGQGYLTGVVGKHGSAWCRFSVPPFASSSETGMGRDPSRYHAFVRGFLGRAKKEGRPFYLAANAHDPHRYWARQRDETKKWIDMMMGSSSWKPLASGKPYPDPRTRFNPADCMVPPSYPDDMRLKRELSKYYDSVNRMDEVVGEVLRALDESGMAGNTIVMFLSDNGLAWEMSKWSLYPAGTKTPLIVRWPGRIEPGRVDMESVVSAVDIAPTIAEACGLAPMERVDGTSFLCLLNGDAARWKRTEAFTCFNYMNNEPKHDDAVKSYTRDLYRKVREYRPSRALSSARFTYIWNGWADGTTELPRSMGGEVAALLGSLAGESEDRTYPDYRRRIRFMKLRAPEELYNTLRDPGCLNDLARYPGHRTVMEGFRTRMAEILEDTGDHESENYRAFIARHSPGPSTP